MEWWQYAIGIIAFIIILGVIVLIHEGGHFFFARKAGILCHEFSIGMGPVLFQKKIGETVYSIRAIPIGGYVSMAGEEVDFDALKGIKNVKLEFDENGQVKSIITDIDNKKYDNLQLYEIVKYDIIGTKEALDEELYLEVKEVKDNLESVNQAISLDFGIKRFIVLRNAMLYMPKKQMAQIAPYNRNFSNKTIWQRFITVFAGPATNFIFAFLLFILLGFTQGYAKENSTELGKFDDSLKAHSPIYKVDETISKGDKILSINGYEVSVWQDITNIMNGFANDKTYKYNDNVYNYHGYLDIEVETKDGEIKTIKVIPNTYVYSIQVVFNAYDNYGSYGYDESGEYLKPYIGEFTSNNNKTLSAKAGLIANDLITGVAIVDKKTEVNDSNFENLESYEKIETIFDLCDYFNKIDESKLVVLRYKRKDESGNPKVYYSDKIETYSKELLDASGISKVKLEMGISPIYEFSFLKILYKPFVNTVSSVVSIFKNLGLLFNKNANVGLDDFSGPIGIFELITTSASEGFNSLVYMTAFLSVNIGFVNLLPLPALDGGRLAFILYEAITKKKPSPKVENIIHSVGFILLIALFIFIGFNDILRLFGLK